jgi:membrane protein YqaA with SNARE-associated domain
LSHILHPLLRFLFHIGYFGPLLMGVLDSSFLFLPFGNDLLIVVLTARHHEGYLLYVLSAVLGSTIGVFLLQLVGRKLGDEGIQRVAGEKRFRYLQRKIGEHGGLALVIACLAPPPFPFTMVVAITAALGYRKVRLLSAVAASRAVRFLILGYLAIKFGRTIIHIVNSAPFRWTMVGFILLCVVGSVYSVMGWWRRGRAPLRTPAAVVCVKPRSDLINKV